MLESRDESPGICATTPVGDVFAQTTQCFEIIKAALEQAGSGLHDIVRTRVILTDID
ncbi:Rid family hydrolase, partial [Rhizobium sp. SIMBA_035]